MQSIRAAALVEPKRLDFGQEEKKLEKFDDD